MHDLASAQFWLNHLLDQSLVAFDQLLAQIPDDQLDFCPVQGMMPAKYVGYHVYQNLLLTTSALKNGRYAEYDLELIPFQPHKIAHIKEVIRYGQYVKEYMYDLKEHLNESMLQKSIPPKKNFSGYNALQQMMEESLHYLGQLTVYLSLIQNKPIYTYPLNYS
jgi:hypothetical protein